MKIEKNLEKFYKKPKNQEELIENMRVLKEIPEDILESKVIVKLGSPEKSHKFVYMQDDDGREYVMALPIEKKDYHRKIVKFAKKLYNRDLSVIGGGYIHTEDGKMIIDKASGDYGLAPKNRVKGILEQKFPNLEIEIRGKSLDGEEVKEKKKQEKEREEGNYEHEINVKDELQKEFYNDVLNKKALRLGLDYTSEPKRIKGSKDLSYMIYSSENGTSFGFDTLYLGYRDESGEVKSKALVKEKGYIHINEIKVEDNVLKINYSCDGEDKEKIISLKELNSIQVDLNLSPVEEKIFNMYQEMQPILKAAKIFHGVSSE
ncbi:MAG TPA: hypothetical protein VJ900_02460 [Patescibacteria group bacterium]|nr:hypothetical protein [Patescibacteria group bacterium]